MVKKDKLGRITLPKDYLLMSGIDINDSSLCFALTNSKQLVITSKDTLRKLEEQGVQHCFTVLASSVFKAENNKIYVYIPEKVEDFLGKGNKFFFSLTFNTLFPRPLIGIRK